MPGQNVRIRNLECEFCEYRPAFFRGESAYMVSYPGSCRNRRLFALEYMAEIGQCGTSRDSLGNQEEQETIEQAVSESTARAEQGRLHSSTIAMVTDLGETTVPDRAILYL